MEDFTSGTTFHGQYRVIRSLGHGVHGAVWEVEHRVLGLLAMKIFTEPPEEDLVTTLREAQVLSGIMHPHIIRVYEAGVLELDDGPRAFLTTELLTGGTLEELIEEQVRISPEMALTIAAQILSALDEIHERNPPVIHRDIIPSNVFIAERQPIYVKVGDFAIAYKTSLGMGMARPEGVIRYFAPESALGYMTTQGDLYAVALILYQMLTGSFPFPEQDGVDYSNVRAVMQSRNAAPRPPSALRSSLGPGMDGLVLRALAPKPSDRFPDAATFRSACLAVLELEA